MGAQASLHPTDQTLSAFGLGKLDDRAAESILQHLEACPDCQGRVAGISGDSFLGRIRGAHGSSRATGPAASHAPPPAADTLPPGLADHPDFEVLRELGRGGMGVVYLAKNRLMGRLEVLKVVGGHLVNRPGVLDRFLREVQSAARLQHKNIVTAYSAMRLGDGLVLSMEYVEGDDLSRVVKTSGPLPVANACYFIYQAALGLQHAHERGMVHRDIKPANLILAREGKKATVKILDFGLAKVTSEKEADSGLTREGQMLGTPDYIAPEQIRDAQKADIRADIYSLGCTFYYLLTGHAPFRGENLWDLYQAHFSMDADPLNLVRPEVPAELASLVAKMLAKEPARRFQTPGEVAQSLTRFFKPGANTGVGSSPEMSRVDGAVAPPARERSLPPQPAPRPATVATPKSSPSGVDLGSLLDLKGPEAEAPAPPVQPGRGRGQRPPRISRAMIAAAAGFGFLTLLLGVIITIRVNKQGTTIDIKPTSDTEQVTQTPAGGGADEKPEETPRGAGKAGPLTQDFKVISGVWDLEGDELVLKQHVSGERSVVVFGSARQDFDFQCKAKSTGPAPGGFGLLFRFTDPGNWHRFLVMREVGRKLSGTAGYIKYKKSQFGNSDIKELDIDGDRWYALRVEVRGARARCFLDGSPVFDRDEGDGNVEAGIVGLQASAGSRFRDIEITSPDGTVLWEGLPDLRAAVAGGSVKGGDPPKEIGTEAAARTLFDPNATYRLTTSFTPKKSLDIRPDEKNRDLPVMVYSGDVPSQQWRITPMGDGWYRIASTSMSGKSLDLDNKDRPVMADTSEALSQQWKILPLGGGSFRIQNRWRTGKSLNVMNDGRAHQRLDMGNTGNWTGEFWKIAATESSLTAAPAGARTADYDAIATGRWIPVLEKQMDLQDRRVYIPESLAGDAIIRARVRKIDGQNLGLALRCDVTHPGLQGYSVWFNGGNSFGIRKWGDPGAELKPIRTPTRFDGEFELALSAVDDVVTVYADGRRIGEARDPEFKRGSFSISAFRGRSHFRDVEIMILDRPTAAADGFVPLFNGKDLTGWKAAINPEQRWKVVDGAIVAAGPSAFTRLDTIRSDFANFHLRVETRLAEGNDGAVDFRVKQPLTEWSYYAAVIPNAASPPIRPGQLERWANTKKSDLAAASDAGALRPGEWFTMEVIADGNTFTVLVNGKEVVKSTDPDRSLASGAIGLFCRANSTVMFRKIEIKELGATKTAEASGIPPDATEHRGSHFKVFAGMLTWHEAKARCEEMGGRLAVVQDDELNRLLTALARNAGVEGAWLGATDAVTEGKWAWVDGSPMAYNHWDVEFKQPNNKGAGEHYLMLLTRREGQWSDQPDAVLDGPAKEHPGFVCEWPGPAKPAEAKKVATPKTKARLKAQVPRNPLPSLRWTGNPGGRGYFDLKPDGTVLGANGKVTGAWQVVGSSLTFRWPNSAAPGGAWIDRLEISGDGSFAAGKNQIGRPVKFYSVR